MKRGKISRVFGSDSGPSFSDLPKDIKMNIFSKLFIHSVLMCKCVCKTWRDLISDPQFAKLHFDENSSRAYPLSHVSGAEPLDPNDCKIGSTIVGIPPVEVNLPYGGFGKKGYCIGSSCNGLLCLSHLEDKSPVVICNPATREYVELPEHNKVDNCMAIRYSLGYSHVSNTFKVVRMIFVGGTIGLDFVWQSTVTAQVHVVGTESWRDISRGPEQFMYCSPAYFNGFLYWAPISYHPLFLTTFDIENECFGLELGPDVGPSDPMPSVGVLGGDLCVALQEIVGTVNFWVRKDCGSDKVWSKVFSIEKDLHGKWIFKSLEPMKCYSDGSFFVFFSFSTLILHIDGKKGTFRFLKICQKERNVEAIFPHITSLVSLKHFLPEQNVKVLDLLSRLGELKLHDPVNDPFIVEDEEWFL